MKLYRKTPNYSWFILCLTLHKSNAASPLSLFTHSETGWQLRIKDYFQKHLTPDQ